MPILYARSEVAMTVTQDGQDGGSFASCRLFVCEVPPIQDRLGILGVEAWQNSAGGNKSRKVAAFHWFYLTCGAKGAYE